MIDMKRLTTFTAAALLSTASLAGGNWLPGVAGALEGQQLAQCKQTCRPGDGQCYQGCAAMYSQPQPNQQSSPVYQSPPPRQFDYQCISRCTQAGYIYQFCQSKCSY